MRKRIAFAATIALVTMLAACGSPSGGNAGTALTQGAAKEDTAKTDNAVDSKTQAPAKGSSVKKTGSPADKFVFRTSEEMSAFMEPYTGEKVLKMSEPMWTMKKDPVTVQGYLTPDKSAFTSVDTTYRIRKNADDTPPEEVLWAFYQDFCDKAEVRFPEAEEKIQSVSSMKNERLRFENGRYVLEVNAYGNNLELSMHRTDASYDSLPYTPDDARAFMENAGGKDEEFSRNVSDDPEIMTGEESRKYAWSGSLDADEHLRSAKAEYSGGDSEEGKAFFTAFTEYFLTGDVLEAGKKLILEHYDTLEDKKTERAEMDKPYSMSMRRLTSDSYSVTISVNEDNVPSDAPVFPNADELAALQLDPIARKGIDKTLGLPETVVFAQDDIKIILESSYYDIFPELCIRFRMDGAQENSCAEVVLCKINGQDVDFKGVKESEWVVDLTGSQPEDEMCLKLPDILNQVPDFTGLRSVTVKGSFQTDITSFGTKAVTFKDITCGTDP